MQIESLKLNENGHGHHIEDNFRPTQDIGDRTVYYYAK
jgi:hypothetical protein